MGRWGVEEVSEAPEKTPYRALGDMITKVGGPDSPRALAVQAKIAFICHRVEGSVFSQGGIKLLKVRPHHPYTITRRSAAPPPPTTSISS